MGVMNAARCGIDVLHLNLHKTFSTPHGGGGPGAGPICVTKQLEPFLPIPRVELGPEGYTLNSDAPLSIGRVHAFYGNYGVLIRGYSYILTMGAHLKRASELAVLNANYLRNRLRNTLHQPYDRPCMHECVFSDKSLSPYKLSTLDLAKALIDKGFHPPTIYFPLVVSGAIMVEPTETECKEDLDRFIDTVEALLDEARRDPEHLRQAPQKTKVRRLDETLAARCPCLTGPLATNTP
jgi:glycine dehydrogenase subunit 2